MEKISNLNRLKNVFLESVAAVNPAKLIAENLKLEGNNIQVYDKTYPINDGNVYVVGFGKAVLGMASQVEKILGKRLVRGIICVPDGIRKIFEGNEEFCLKKNSTFEVFEGAKYNLPDKKAEEGADAIINLVSSLDSKRDSLIVLISGGGSALLPKPQFGIDLNEKLDTIRFLGSSGANITELNIVRKKLSKVKGGKLACLAYPVRTITFILSDVLKDRLDIIASGPTVPNLDSNDAAYSILKKYNLLDRISENVLKVIRLSSSDFSRSIDSHNFQHVDNFLIGNNIKALNAAKLSAKYYGFEPIILSSEVSGDIQDVANFYKNLMEVIIRNILSGGNNFFEDIKKLIINCTFGCELQFLNDIEKLITVELTNNKPVCIVAGGEVTVRVKGKGTGGRNQELALLMSIKLNELKLKYKLFFDKYSVIFLSAGTDGIDGPTDVAGAIVKESIFEQSLENSIIPNEYLQNNDSHNFFLQVNNGKNLIKTGHTGTNVADIYLLSIYKKKI